MKLTSTQNLPIFTLFGWTSLWTNGFSIITVAQFAFISWILPLCTVWFLLTTWLSTRLSNKWIFWVARCRTFDFSTVASTFLIIVPPLFIMIVIIFAPLKTKTSFLDQVIWGQLGINYLVDAIFALWAALLIRSKLVLEGTGQKWTSFNRRTHFWSNWATITCRTTFSWCWLLNTILKLSCEKIKSGSFEVKRDQYSFGKGSFQVINGSLVVTEGRKSIPLDKFCIFHDWIWFLLFRNDQHMFPFYTDLLVLAKNFSRFNLVKFSNTWSQ